MNAKHTPGPWNAASKVLSGCFQIVPVKTGLRICTVTNGSSEEANARLIAAAPELLEALAFYVRLCGNTGYAVSRETFSEMHAQAAKAIAKATGETERALTR